LVLSPKTISFNLLVSDMFEQHNTITQSTAFFEPDTGVPFYLMEASSMAQ
jgi:hypothetical protein